MNTSKKSNKPKKTHPWRANAAVPKGQTKGELHHTRIASFNRMGIRI